MPTKQFYDERSDFAQRNGLFSIPLLAIDTIFRDGFHGIHACGNELAFYVILRHGSKVSKIQYLFEIFEVKFINKNETGVYSITIKNGKKCTFSPTGSIWVDG